MELNVFLSWIVDCKTSGIDLKTLLSLRCVNKKGLDRINQVLLFKQKLAIKIFLKIEYPLNWEQIKLPQDEFDNFFRKLWTTPNFLMLSKDNIESERELILKWEWIQKWDQLGRKLKREAEIEREIKRLSTVNYKRL